MKYTKYRFTIEGYFKNDNDAIVFLEEMKKVIFYTFGSPTAWIDKQKIGEEEK